VASAPFGANGKGMIGGLGGRGFASSGWGLGPSAQGVIAGSRASSGLNVRRRPQNIRSRASIGPRPRPLSGSWPSWSDGLRPRCGRCGATARPAHRVALDRVMAPCSTPTYFLIIGPEWGHVVCAFVAMPPGAPRSLSRGTNGSAQARSGRLARSQRSATVSSRETNYLFHQGGAQVLEEVFPETH